MSHTSSAFCSDYSRHRRWGLHGVDGEGHGHCSVCSPAHDPDALPERPAGPEAGEDVTKEPELPEWLRSLSK